MKKSIEPNIEILIEEHFEHDEVLIEINNLITKQRSVIILENLNHEFNTNGPIIKIETYVSHNIIHENKTHGKVIFKN